VAVHATCAGLELYQLVPSRAAQRAVARCRGQSAADLRLRAGYRAAGRVTPFFFRIASMIDLGSIRS
jgi:hypothetical protein